jgi:murein DD-endopeptidase MepM/ murein hydrolase activator NlpD
VQNEKTRILAQVQRYRDHQPARFATALAVGGLSLFGVVAAFATATSVEPVVATRPVVEQLALPVADPFDAADEVFVREERIRRDDTVAALLSRLGIQDAAAIDFMRSAPAAAPIFRQMSPGKVVTARVDEDGGLEQLTFPLNGGDRALTVSAADGDGFTVSEDAIQLDRHIVMKSARIRYSLFGASDAADIPDTVATQLADIFGGDIDFQRDIRKGDRFSVIYESLGYLGRPLRSGRILAAEFVNDGRTYRAFWFDDEHGNGGYYTAAGKSVRKAFLRSPLEFSRITSGFSSARMHPILHQMRAHQGIDFGAPVGTRVKTTGDGVVEFVGNRGGYGKVVIVRHQTQYETLYGHLSGFAASLHVGSRVHQGDVIGFVGATGLATGPHLHYEFRVAGVHRNPLAISLPDAPPLAAAQLPAFHQRLQPVLADLTRIGGTDLALLDE